MAEEDYANRSIVQRAIERLRQLQGDDPESGHMEADEILCGLLSHLGYGDVVAEWNKVSKWYA